MRTRIAGRGGRAPAGGAALLLALSACAPEPGGEPDAGETIAAGGPSAVELLAREFARVEARAAEIDSLFQPLPLLRPAEQAELSRFGNAAQLERARALGIGRNPSAARLTELLAEGRLVRLADNEFWVVRDLDYSRPLVIPGVRDLLAEIGARFHARLAAIGAPAFRIEISSALRSAEDQARLRQVNPNAALDESTHEYGTTVDVAYNGFAAPAEPIVAAGVSDSEGLRPFVERHAEVAAERIAGRRSLEIQAILGQVLIELQREGRLMVTLERQQPVYHMTLSR